MSGYTRQSSYNDGDVVQADDSNSEFDQLVGAFSNTIGHAHDGTPAEGPVIGLIGDAGVVTPLNKVAVDTGNDRISFYIDVSAATTEQLRVEDGVVYPAANNDIDLGTAVYMFKDGFFAGTLKSASLKTTNISANDGASSATIADGTGVFTIASAVLTTADINGGTIDGTVIGGTTPAAGNFTTGSFTGDVSFGDNDKAIFGAGSDLQIYSDGASNDYIDSTTSHVLQIRGSDVRLGKYTGETFLRGAADGAVTLYYDNAIKLATTSTGVDITGTMYLNRTTTDGGIAEFYKDGSTVGSIGTAGGTTYIDGGSQFSGLQFGGDGASEGRITPRKSGASSDNTTDLGTPSLRFKDLYLSGGVYLGGTGSANKLDDYEEGTFTPALQTSDSNLNVSYTTQHGSYTKIGNVVTIQIYALISGVTSQGTGSLKITGLPFSNTTYQEARMIPFSTEAMQGDSATDLYRMRVNGAEIALILEATGGSVNTGSVAANYFIINGTYKTA